MNMPYRLVKSALACALASTCAMAHAATPANAGTHPVAAIQDTETPAQRDARMAWWRAARYGMFIHWGVYSVPAGVWQGKPVDGAGEWIMHDARIPVAEYKQLPARFDPMQFDAHTWVSLAKAAGMKYIVITAKHHDGFAMFDSKANAFNIVDATPFKHDPLRALADEAKRQGIKFGVYYSQDQDWTAPGGAAIGGHWDKAQDGDFATYLQTKAIPQIKELLVKYHPAVLWFDTPTREMTPQLASEIVKLLDRYPQLIWNNRLGGGYAGDTETPEQHIPPQGFPGKDWETCMTINDTWGYKSADTDFKSTTVLLRNLVDIASKGGNYLLNVGPDAHGVIPAAEAERLQAIGQWLKINGESIYGTHPTPFADPHGSYSTTQKDSDGKPAWVPTWDWRATSRPGKVYIHLLEWPGSSFHVADANIHATGAYLLADPRHTPLKFTQHGTQLDVQLPAKPLDPIDTVLVVTTNPR
ncbi:alpha-L-fucosidase [Rhodanobacter sp. 7MK24]|uniref:alpha-L-fucosidase n=1 Tax=Rhodanobacter sp. 7MK24 TaxID=2775922 RepID=UPI00177E55C0|nr:alpha-L-fucosidase [Rhodanobacter sp. 7MK24]MBD8880445.1 alpha-L-fucosidase [Rhodanobacter sp. 7MK24]